MADTYIDPNETIIYGPFACEQMEAVCLGLVPSLDGAVRFAIAQQRKADEEMRDVLSRIPAASPAPQGSLDDTRDLLVRFGKHLESLKGRPLDLAVFYGREAPSVVARRRVPKLVGAVRHVLAKIDEHEAKIRDAKTWRAEFAEALAALEALDRQQRTAKVDAALARPEIAEARAAWLAVYVANKSLVQGVLRHAGREELMPLVFDDLAETHRTSGTRDEEPAPSPAPVARPNGPQPNGSQHPAPIA